MKPKVLFLKLYLFSFGLSALLIGCGMVKQTVWVEDYLVTFYSIPRTIQVGEMQLAVRVQDREYRILPEAARSLEVVRKATGQHTTIVLKTGLGKDVKGWMHFPTFGEYTLLFHFADSTGQTLAAQFPIQIIPRQGKWGFVGLFKRLKQDDCKKEER